MFHLFLYALPTVSLQYLYYFVGLYFNATQYIPLVTQPIRLGRDYFWGYIPIYNPVI